MIRLRAPTWIALVLALAPAAACSDGEIFHIRVRVVPHADNCGQDPGARSVTIRAYGNDSEVTRFFVVGAPISIDNFPSSTRQLSMTITGPNGGTVAVGKTAPFSLDEPPVEIPIALAPLDGMCRLGDMRAARERPLVARAGDGALILGGDAIGMFETAEIFDPAIGGFLPVELPQVLRTPGRTIGAVMVELPDGRVLVTGGGFAIVYDPALRAFDVPVLANERYFHTATLIGPDEVLLAGGCSRLTGTTCDPTSMLMTTERFRIDGGPIDDVATTQQPRIGGLATVELGAGTALVAIAGGIDPAGAPTAQVDRIQPGVGFVEQVAASGVPVVLDSGSLMLGFAPAGAATANDESTFVTPGSAAAWSPTAPTQPRIGAILTTLEDGNVVAIGDEADSVLGNHVSVFRPMTAQWDEVAAVAGDPPLYAIRRHGQARLTDGSVLIVGGLEGAGAGATPTARAYRFRPSLVGATDVAATVTVDGDYQLVPFAVGDIERGGGMFVVSNTTPTARNFAIVSGPRMATGTLTATLRVVSATGGAFLIAGSTSPSDRYEAVFDPGSPARIVRVAGGIETTLCEGSTPIALPPSTPFTAELEIRDGSATARIDGAGVVGCAIELAAEGAWGAGALGEFTRLAIDTATVVR
jgi:hypothetical protein